MSRVNVDPQALNDGRFRALGLALGAPGEFAHDAGLARMVRLWSYCTEQGRHTLDAWEVDAQIGVAGAAAHLVAYRLAEETADGLYIKGTRGRIEWLAAKRRGAAKSRVLVGDTTKSTDVPQEISADVPQDIQEQEIRVRGSSLVSVSSPDPDPDPDARATPQLALVPAEPEPSVDVRAVHDAVYSRYPASRRTGKTKGLEALRRSLRTPEDVARFERVVDAHLASASEESYVRHWERLCRTWPEMPDVMPARASPRVSGGGLSVDELIGIATEGT